MELARQETKIQTTSEDLRKILQLETVKQVPAHLLECSSLLKQKRYKEVADLMPRTIEKAVAEGVPMLTVEKVTNQVSALIEYQLIRLAAMVNVDQRLNLQKHQVPLIAQELYNNFKFESIEDISVCFTRGAMGMYGEIYRMDGAVVSGWMQKYLEEKYAVVERNLMAEKDNIYQVKRQADKPTEINPERNLLAALKIAVSGDLSDESLQKNLTPKQKEDILKAAAIPVAETNNANANAYERYKLERDNDPKVILQKKINDTASEFYQAKGGYKNIQTWTADNGFYVFAESEEDAKAIYLKATEE
jgi:hypothetical protein